MSPPYDEYEDFDEYEEIEEEEPGIDIEAFKNLPDDEKTSDLCLTAVRQNWINYLFVPDYLKTWEICKAAVQGNGTILRDIPEEILDKQLCKAAVKAHGSALKYVPKSMKTLKICRKAVKRFGKALKYVPDSKKSLEICLAAIKKDWRALKYVPKHMKTPELCAACAEGFFETDLSAIKASDLKSVGIDKDLVEYWKSTEEASDEVMKEAVSLFYGIQYMLFLKRRIDKPFVSDSDDSFNEEDYDEERYYRNDYDDW